MKKLILYTKPQCHLCDEMKVVLNELKKEFIFYFEEVSIEKDPELFEKYKEKIPVLLHKGRMIGKYRIDKKKFIKFLLQ